MTIDRNGNQRRPAPQNTEAENSACKAEFQNFSRQLMNQLPRIPADITSIEAESRDISRAETGNLPNPVGPALGVFLDCIERN